MNADEQQRGLMLSDNQKFHLKFDARKRVLIMRKIATILMTFLIKISAIDYH